MKNVSLSGHSVADLSNKISLAITDDFTPTLAISFGSVDCDLTEYVKVFDKHNIQLFGASSAGEFVNDELLENGLVVMLLDIDSSAFAIHHEETDFASSFSTGQRIAKFGADKFDDPIFLLTFSMVINGEGIMMGIHDLIPREKIFGGMAGDDAKMVASYSFTNNNISASSVTTLVLDGDKIRVDGIAYSGWEPVGGKNIITKSVDNIVYEINDQPATTMVREIFGEFYETLESVEVMMGAAQYPFQIIRDEKYILRAVLYGNEKDNSLVLAGTVEEGEEFRFSVAPGFEIIDETLDKFQEYAKTIPTPDAVIMFSCKARHMSLGPLIEDELAGIHDIWGKDMIGFFSYGEIGMDADGSTNYYNETCSLVMISDK